MLKLYMDQHIPRAITVGLRMRGIEVISAYEDGSAELDDSALLNRANDLGCVLFTQDDDLLKEAAKRQKSGTSFLGVIYAHQLSVSIGGCINDLEIIGKAAKPEELFNSVIFLPLR